MANFAAILTLIKQTPQDNKTDDQGFYLPPVETKREVFANRKSVGYSEFYKSSQAGTVAQLKMIVRTDEYQEEELVEYEGRRYKVLRTYETALNGGSRGVSNSGEYLELTLTNLPTRDDPEPVPDGGDSDGKI